MTPAELNLYADAYVERRREALRLEQINLYNLAALIRPMVWSKHPPRLERVFPQATRKEPQKEMTDEQMYAQVVALNRLFGGEEVD